MDIIHSQEGNKGKFYIKVADKVKAEMTYTFAGSDKIIIDHTEVDESLRGKKVGNNLVEEAVKFAREKNIKILPLCPFAKHVMEKNSDYNDILF